MKIFADNYYGHSGCNVLLLRDRTPPQSATILYELAVYLQMASYLLYVYLCLLVSRIFRLARK